MRQVVLDTETTGVDWKQGHRVIEIGAVELLDRRLSGRHYQQYLNPERPSDPDAIRVHGITDAFLQDKPRFAEVVEEFLAFIAGAELIIHNAPFDMGFINHELRLLQRKPIAPPVLDTLVDARRRHPGQKNDLNSLCRRYGVDNSGRELHGALLDCEILAQVYLAMTGGQVDMGLDTGKEIHGGAAQTMAPMPGGPALRQSPLRVIAASAAERELHRRYLAGMGEGACLWPQDGSD